MPATIHWDDAPSFEDDLGAIGGRWTELAGPAGAVRLGVNRAQVLPGRAATPQHAEDEELFFVLGGSGHSVQEDGVFAIRAGDLIRYRAWEVAHTVVAGDDGLDIIAFGLQDPPPGVRFPRLDKVKVGDHLVSGDTTHQWELEAALGPIELPEQPDPRPATIANLDEVEPREYGSVRAWWFGGQVGARVLAANVWQLDPGCEGVEPHCHSSIEEVFVVLDGGGVLLLGPDETPHPVRRGSVVARPPATGVAHAFRAGDDGMRVLMLSDTSGSDMVFYPRTGKVLIDGLGITIKPEIVPWGAG